MKRAALWAVVFLSVLFAANKAYSFSIEPARVDLLIGAGQQKGKTIYIDNSKGDAPIRVKIYPQDITYLPDGTHDFSAPGTTSWSCSNWVQAVPSEIDVPAGKIKSVRVSVNVPKGVGGGRYSTLFFEAGSGVAAKGIGVNLRIGAMVLVTIPGTENYKAKLSNISFTKPQGVELGIFNEGNVLLRPSGKVKVVDSRGKRVMMVNLNPNRAGILPQTLRKFDLQLGEGLLPGKYTLRAEVDFGQDYLLVGELPIVLD